MHLWCECGRPEKKVTSLFKLSTVLSPRTHQIREPQKCVGRKRRTGAGGASRHSNAHANRVTLGILYAGKALPKYVSCIHLPEISCLEDIIYYLAVYAFSYLTSIDQCIAMKLIRDEIRPLVLFFDRRYCLAPPPPPVDISSPL